MDIAGPVIGAVGLLWESLAQRCYYMASLERLLESLDACMEELNNRENDIKTEISAAAVNPRKRLKSEVNLWLKNVEKANFEVNRTRDKISQRGRCIRGCFPNYFRRHTFGKLVMEKIKEVNQLREKGVFPNGLFLDLLLETGKVVPTTVLIGKRTTEKILPEICKCLASVNIGKVGIYGMGGVGKTSVMMHVYNHLNEAQSFNNIYWVTAPKAFNLEKLQIDIATAVDLDLSAKETMHQKSALLFDYLQKKKRFVLILDDLWYKFSLEDVGIPQPSEENGCKLVFITRLMEVCRGMETHREIKMEVLSKEDAWDLFVEKVGLEDSLSPEIESIARFIPEECGRLPLAVVTVGRTMRKINDVRIWSNALHELRSSRAEIDGMEEDVFARLRFSFNYLKNDRSRSCLVYCALFPDNCKIDVDELVEYWMAEGLIDELGDRENEINKGHAILRELTDACMLENAGTRSVKMHDLVRDLAIRITEESPRCFIAKAGLGLQTFPKEWMKDVQRVSLMENNITFLPEYPESRDLLTLLLQRNPLSKSIEDSFFVNMYNLRVLNLSGTYIESLPDSVSSLRNLRALLLCFCELEELPSLALLKELRVLDLSYSLVVRLSDDIEGLVNLRRLDLSYTEELNVFPSAAVSKLSRLENLSMFKSKWRWSLSSDGEGHITDFSAITNSSRLNNLGLSFNNLYSFNSYVKSEHWRVLKSYHIGIGLLSCFASITKGTFCVEIQGCNIVTGEGLIVLPDNTQHLALHGCHDIDTLSKLTGKSTLAKLKECYVSTCNQLTSIINDDNSFLSLERLVLRKLPNLRAICCGVVGAGGLSRLKSLQIHNCKNLKSISSIGCLHMLQNLEEIEVWNSPLIEEMIEEDGNNGNANATLPPISFPRLRRISFSSLPDLRNISRREVVCEMLESLEVRDCGKLKKLPFSVKNLPISLHMMGSKSWWDNLEWDEPTVKSYCEPFFKEDGLRIC